MQTTGKARRTQASPSRAQTVLGLVGLALAFYGVVVERNIAIARRTGEKYTALCDIEAVGASCSSALGSEAANVLSYWGVLPKGHVLDLSNAEAGLLFYSAVALAPWVRAVPGDVRVVAVLLASIATALISLYLAYVLVVVLHEVCPLCSTMQFINALIVCVAIVDFAALVSPPKPKLT